MRRSLVVIMISITPHGIMEAINSNCHSLFIFVQTVTELMFYHPKPGALLQVEPMPRVHNIIEEDYYELLLLPLNVL